MKTGKERIGKQRYVCKVCKKRQEAIFASSAMIVSMPDYLGYGVSSNLPHPYEHGKSLATASYDMLKACLLYTSPSPRD